MQRWCRGVASGVVAGLFATGAMSVFMLGAKAVGALGEPPPRRITRRALSKVLGPFRPRGKALDATALVAHFGFGASMGAVHGMLPERARSLVGGLPFGALVWVVNYAGWLPDNQLMPEPSRDRPGRPTAMVLAHLVFGVALSSAHRRLDPPARSVLGPRRREPWHAASRP